MHRTPSHPARRIVGSLALATTALLAACGGGGDSGYADPAAQNDPKVHAVLLVASAQKKPAGQSICMVDPAAQ